MTPDVAELERAVDAALAARARLRGRPLERTAAALAAAAARWAAHAGLRAELPGVTRLSPAMVVEGLRCTAAALDADAMLALAERERGDGEGPALVAAVVASNVPAQAVTAIALGCLAGAAVLVKSGRADPLSAPAFRRALAEVDPALADTVVAAYWPGGTRAVEDALLGRADVVVASGGDATVAALARHIRPERLIAHGSRTSLAALDLREGRSLEPLAAAVARDVALYDQRGCLSPHVALVVGDHEAFADAVVRALAAVRTALPPGPATVEERAAVRLALEEASWAGTHAVRPGLGGAAMVETWADMRPGPGGRTLRVCPLASLADLAAVVPVGGIECIAVHGQVVDVAALRERGVARLCRPGRMQEPPLAWPRGQRAALGSLLRPDDRTPLLAAEELAP